MCAASDAETLNVSASPVPHPCSPQALLYEHWGAQGVEGTLRILPPRGNGALQTGYDLLSTRPLVLLGIGADFVFRLAITGRGCSEVQFALGERKSPAQLKDLTHAFASGEVHHQDAETYRAC